MSNYTPTIGLEVHAELKTKSKMFCGCTNDPHASEVNSNTCPVCLAHPGTLPVVNKEAVKHVVTFGTAVGASIATYSEFDRKNYFYPDIPKAYQISQYAFPFVSGGVLSGVELTRVHLEEDTARNQHVTEASSVVDFNRSGVPLMELVTEPVIHDSETAVKFAKELQLLLRTLGISDANMERGEMRIEANISVSNNDELGTKVEVKNLNSFRSVGMAIEYEVKRQVALLENGEVVKQETRGWDENRDKTFSQRSKETAKDYRYFPDPDIPKMQLAEIKEFSVSRITEKIPELPDNKRYFLKSVGLSDEHVETLVSNVPMSKYFDVVHTLAGDDEALIKLSVNYLITDMSASADFTSSSLLSPEQFVGLMKLVQSGDINSRTAKDLIAEFVSQGADLAAIAEERGLTQKSSTDELLPIVKTVIAENESVVTEYKNGKEASLKFLVGQGMKATKGTANPEVLQSLLKEEIGKN